MSQNMSSFVNVMFPIIMLMVLGVFLFLILLGSYNVGNIPWEGWRIVTKQNIEKGYDIRLRRHKLLRQRGVPYVNIGYSADCYLNWGKSDTGSSDLARNILELYVDDNTANELYHIFREKFITPMPYKGGNIKDKDIKAWIKENTN